MDMDQLRIKQNFYFRVSVPITPLIFYGQYTNCACRYSNLPSIY